MAKWDVKVDNDLEEKVIAYATHNKITNKSQAIRELVEKGLGGSPESELVKEIKQLRGELADTRTNMNQNTERLVKISIKSQKFILAIWHLVQITIFFRSKDKGMGDNECIKSRDDSASFAMSYALKDLNGKE